jgi:hypothetical protein
MTIPLLKIKVLPKATVKGKMDVRFPANVLASNFLTVVKANGTYTFDIDYTKLGATPILDPTTAMVAVLDQSAGLYKVVSLAALLVSGLDADLQAIAAMTGTGVLSRTAANTWALRTLTGTANEITVTNGGGVAGNETLSLPTLLTFTGKTVTGGTFASPTINTPAGIVKGDVGLGNVDNTSDVNKPVSTAQSTALALKADLASPTFTGTPTAPTPTAGDNSTKIATTAFVAGFTAGGLPYYVVPGTIDNTGATDIGTALNAFIQSTPLYSIIILPLGIYQTTTTILVNGGRTLMGASGGIQAGTLTAGSCIRGALTLSPVVKADGGLGSSSITIKNLNITRVTGTVATTLGSAIGLQVWRCNNATFEDVYVSRHSTGIDLLDLNVTINFHRCTAFFCTQFYMAMHAQAIEITCSKVRFGMNGSQDFTGMTGYLYMDGGGWDTIRFDNSCQWNSSQADVQWGIYFNAYNQSNPNGIFQIANLHCEGLTQGFIVGVSCTQRILRFKIANSQINGGANPFIATASLFDQSSISNCNIMMPLTLDTQTNFNVSGNLLGSTLGVNAGTGNVITSNQVYGATTLTGTATKTLLETNVLIGALTNTGSGFTVGNNA